MFFWAHIKKEADNTYRFQTLLEHSQNVSNLAGQNAKKIGLEHAGELVGILHDMGKAHHGFQTYLQESVDGKKREKMDHSSVGAREIFLLSKKAELDKKEESKANCVNEMLANVIAGHHSGLLDYLACNLQSPFLYRRTKDIPYEEECRKNFYGQGISEDLLVEIWIKAFKEINELLIFNERKCRGTIQEENEFLGATISSITNYLYSALIDADRLDAYLFDAQKDIKTYKEEGIDWKKLQCHLENEVKKISNDQGINHLRAQFSSKCKKEGKGNCGLYSLTMPVGSGKTLASLRFAMEHLRKNKKEKLVVILPYISIIEQNAAVIRETLGVDDELLEYHSQVGYQNEEDTSAISHMDDDIVRRDRSLEERWDKPIICTSLVQLLNTFFGGKSSYARRLHQLANSVIIFDEVQSVPLHVLRFFWHARDFLVEKMNSTVVLMTATQPDMKKRTLSDGGAEIHDIIPDIGMHWSRFKRVKFDNRTRKNIWGDVGETDKIINLENAGSFLERELADTDSLIWVFNTKRAMRKVAEKCKENGRKIDLLDTYFCPQHRKDKIRQIKARLHEIQEQKKRGKPIPNEEKLVLFSTQLIEAGVDISFEKAVRNLSSMVSVWQTAGRCNRNGERNLGKVIIVRLSGELEKTNSLLEIANGIQTSENLFAGISETADLDSFDIQSKYFEEELKIINQSSYGEQMWKDYPISSQENLWNIWTMNKNAVSALIGRDGKIDTYLTQGIATVKRQFNVIKNDRSISVVVPYKEEGNAIISDLVSDMDYDSKLKVLRKAQLYSIQMQHDKAFDRKLKEEAIQICDIGRDMYIYVLADAYYTDDEGFIERGGVLGLYEY